MSVLADLLARLRTPPRTGPLIVTIWGDAVVPRGGSLWLGTLERIVAPFGINPGQLRTAMSRLVEDGWLARTRVGRLSFYRLGPRGEEFAAADRRIYAPAVPDWDGRFRLVVAPDEATRDALLARGWGAAGPDLFVGLTEFGHDPDDPHSPGHGSGIRLRAVARSEDSHALAARAWTLDEVATRYDRFLAAFASLDGAAPAPEESLPLRVLLAHEFRRAALRDPGLPDSLLTHPWPGTAARALAVRLYRALLPASEAWLDAEGRSEDGPLPPPGRTLCDRFAGA